MVELSSLLHIWFGKRFTFVIVSSELLSHIGEASASLTVKNDVLSEIPLKSKIPEENLNSGSKRNPSCVFFFFVFVF